MLGGRIIALKQSALYEGANFTHFRKLRDKNNNPIIVPLTPEVFAASIDYYVKYKKQLNHERVDAINAEFYPQAKHFFISKFLSKNKDADNLHKYSVSDFDISWDKKKAGSKDDIMHTLDVTVKTKDGSYSKVVNVFPSNFSTKIYESKFDTGGIYQNMFYPIKADRVNLISETSMSYRQSELYKNAGLTKNEMWEKWREDRGLIDQKILDMQGHLDDYRSAYTKGRETSYGDANLNDGLLEKYGVMIKRQNGDPIDKEETAQIETALRTVTKVFGNLKDISREYGLKISHSSDKLMHASQYTGLFTPYYKSVGVSFKRENSAPLILTHEYAHFLDAFAGGDTGHFFASDVKNSPEYNTAGLFRAAMNDKDGANRYYKRTSECFARAMEQYAAYKTSTELYKDFCSLDYYCSAESFEKIIPEIEKLIETRRPLWKSKTAENENYIDVVNNEAETITARKPASEISIYDNFLSDFASLAKNDEYSDDRVEAARFLLRNAYAPFKRNILQEMKERGCISPEASRAYLLNVLDNARTELQYSERYAEREIDFSNGDAFKVYYDDAESVYTILSYDKSGASIGYGREGGLQAVERWLKEHGADDNWELSTADETPPETPDEKPQIETPKLPGISEKKTSLERMFNIYSDRINYLEKKITAVEADINALERKDNIIYSKTDTGKIKASLKNAKYPDVDGYGGTERKALNEIKKRYEYYMDKETTEVKSYQSVIKDVIICINYLDGGITREDALNRLEQNGFNHYEAEAQIRELDDVIKNDGRENKDSLQFSKEYRPYGAWLDWNKRLSEKQRAEANQKVLELLKKDGGFSEDDKNTLRRYSGFGGINADNERGVLYDYYTSPPVAGLTWRLLDKISPLKTGESVLEPSCGTGVFIETAPPGLLFTGVEIDKRTAAVAGALHDKAAVLNMSFEQFNLSDMSGGFDRVIGNVPFGVRPADDAELDMKNEKSLDNYFVSRSIDNLKDGGALALITAPGLLYNKSNETFRNELSKKAQFLGAVQLPNKSFYHTRTAVQPAVLFFKKYPADVARRLQALDDKTFQSTSFYDRNFAEGDYFKAYPHHVMGGLSEGSGQFGADEITGDVTQDGIENILSAFTPAYQYDDAAFDDIRRTYALPEKKQKTEAALSGAEVSLLQADKLPSVKISDNALWVLSNDSRWDFVSDDKTLIDKIERTTRLADAVAPIREAMKAGGENIKLYQSYAKAVLDTYKTDYGEYPLDDKDVRRFVNKYPAVKGVYDAFITPSSEILTSDNIYKTDVEIVDGHNPAVKALVDLQNVLIPATEENIRARFPADADGLIEEMFVNKDIFYTPKGVWLLREDFISGDAWRKIDILRGAAASAENERIKQKLLYGADELEKAAGWTPIEEADVSPRSAWLDEDIIRDWAAGEDGLGKYELVNLAKNNEGKWGVTDGRLWQEYHHPLVYYLNNQKQRSINIDTKAYNEDHDELFKSFISNHDEHRQSIERKYNRLFKTYLTAPVKTYPVDIKGWQNAADGRGKTLKPHQWQTIHHLYRQGSGISALGTGFGKTASAVGLMSLLRQEGRLSRVWLQVPNNKVKDWITEIKDVMPSLKIASIDPEEPGYSNRDKRYARYRQTADSKADVIIMPESAASEIQLKKDNDSLIREKIAGDYKTEKINAKASKRKTAMAELKGFADTQNGKTNRTINFEDFGCDAVFVDEAHNYKNLFSSSLSRETGMNDGRQSAKALSLFKKTEFIRENNNGKNVFLLTATPLTNSPLEYYNMLQFIAADELKRFGVMSIDGFINEFADIKEGIRYDWTKNRAGWGKILSGFKNLQTLQELFFKYTDLQNNPDAVGIEKPEPRNIPNLIPSDNAQTSVLKSISAEIERYRSMDKEEREAEFPNQNFLTFYSRMRTASLDLELFDPDAYKNWKNPKLEKLAANVKSIYNDTKGGQVVFCDRIFDSNAAFNLHDKIKSSLIGQGFKNDDIIIINGFTKSGDKRSDAAVEKDVSKAIEGFNSGKYKVIIGTTACIGEGVNLQKNSAAVHHFDIPFRPSDFIQRNGRVDRQGNEQEKVELHTYLASGTIDNYSAALVQNKADWIDKLLRTKSSVFTNPDDENSIDMNELLLSLTEEWGDMEKAGAMREQLRRQKEQAEREAWNKKMKANIKSLSLLRNALQSVKNTNGRDYKNRLDKIHNLERALSDNPVFDKPDIIGSLEPFLYNAKYNTVIRKGDVLLRNNLETVTGFDFKKQSFLVEPLFNPDEKTKCQISQLIPITDNNNLPYRERSDNPLKHHFEKPDENQKLLLGLLNNADAFYGFRDKNVTADYYHFHLACFSSWHKDKSFDPPVFHIDNSGGLSIGYAHYYTDENGVVDALNPFIQDDKQKILDALNNKPNPEKSVIHYDDNFVSLIEKHFPDIYQNLMPHLINVSRGGGAILDKITAAEQQKITDYRNSGFGSISQSQASFSVLRNKNTIYMEKMKMETNQNLNGQAGTPPGQDVNPDPAVKPWEKTYSPQVMADPAAKAHAFRGAAEWRTNNGAHRLYFNFSAKKALYGLSTFGKQQLPPEKTAELRLKYHSAKLPDFPEKAFHNGKPISPDKAFEILCSNPYYDVNQKKLTGLLPDVQTRTDFLKQRSLDMGGKEYVNTEKGTHRIYFQSAAAVKNLYGLETKGKVALDGGQLAEAQKKFPYNKFLPNMPESASLRGEPIDPQRAFNLLASQPYFDVNTCKFETFSKEKTFDKFISDEFAKKGLTDERRAELFDTVAKYDARIAANVKEAQIFAAQSRMELPVKDMTPPQQFKAFLASAVEKNKVPWEQEFSASAAYAPLNYASGRQFSRSNLLAASLHMAHIDSNDPRYMTDNEIQKNGLMVDEKALPLKIAYRVQDKHNGSYQTKTTTYYNAKDIAGLPPLQLPKSINELSPPITPEHYANADEQITGNIAGFIAALSSNKGFQPMTSNITHEDYKAFSDLPVKDLFTQINAASSKAAEISQPQMQSRLERGKQAAGMEM